MTRQLIRALQVLIASLWTPIAFAGVLLAQGPNSPLLEVPAVLVIASVIVSTLAGATTLALAIVRELKVNSDAGTPQKALLHPWAAAAAHMLGSWLASTFFFFVCMAQGAGAWMLLATVLIAAFCGAKALEVVADKFLLSRLPKDTP
jgi:hypothetical protein